MKVVSLFSGIAGLEVGLGKAGFDIGAFCENDPSAQAVLEERFPGTRLFGDIASMTKLPKCELMTAGWPCQDLSQAGKVAGMMGSRSNLVGHVFRLLDGSEKKPDYLLLENVAFALHLRGGEAIKQVTKHLSERGYYWAYRILDTREFGLPQRRRRIFIAASRTENPLDLLYDGEGVPTEIAQPKQIGFYWTEGNRGIGWSVEAIPPMKGGSSFSIPSPPAIWDLQSSSFFVPGIRDAEKLQGFTLDWTKPADSVNRVGRVRWRLVGNAVSTPVAQWIGHRLAAKANGTLAAIELPPISRSLRHNVAWGGPHLRTKKSHLAVEGPQKPKHSHISDFNFRESKPLSQRAAAGFLLRLLDSPLRLNSKFVEDLKSYCRIGLKIEDKAA